MLKKWMPREENFFDLFHQMGVVLVECTRAFVDLLKQLPDSETGAKRIADLEHQGDEITHHTVERLHMTFITPFDREDIHELISRMDDVADYVHATAQRFQMYGILSVPKEVFELADICVRSAEQVQKGLVHLQHLKDPQELMKICVEIHRLENEGDQVLRAGVAKLFREENDVKQLIKLKEVFELLEGVTDYCEDVANIFEGIVLEYA